jgi:hypothetical protein
MKSNIGGWVGVKCTVGEVMTGWTRGDVMVGRFNWPFRAVLLLLEYSLGWQSNWGLEVLVIVLSVGRFGSWGWFGGLFTAVFSLRSASLRFFSSLLLFTS